MLLCFTGPRAIGSPTAAVGDVGWPIPRGRRAAILSSWFRWLATSTTWLGALPADLLITGKGDQPAEIVLNPRSWQAIDAVIADRSQGPLLRNQWGDRMRRHSVAALLRRLARTAGIGSRVTPHAVRRSYITIGLQQGVPLRDRQRTARHATSPIGAVDGLCPT